MAGIERVHGGVGAEGVINGKDGFLVGASIKFFDITVAGAGGNGGSDWVQDLRPEMGPADADSLGGAVEHILRNAPSGILAYFVPNAATGKIYLAVDGHATFAASTGNPDQPGLQEMIQSLGTVPTVAGGTMGVNSSTVALGTGFTVTP